MSPFLLMAILLGVYTAWRSIVALDDWLTQRANQRRAHQTGSRMDQATFNALLRADGFVGPLPDGLPGLTLKTQRR